MYRVLFPGGANINANSKVQFIHGEEAMEGENVLVSLLLASCTQDWNQMKDGCSGCFFGMSSKLE
jgi:hypothetical protein